MANLITDKQKREIKVDYYVRFASVSLIVPISLLGIFLLAYIVPYYLSVSKKDAQVSEKFNSLLNIENKENIGESATRLVSKTQEQMKVAELYVSNEFSLSAYFSKIILSKNKSIQITQLATLPGQSKQKQFLVSGLAKNRDGLVLFINDLKTTAGFAEVETPISDFAKEKDITFTLTVKTAI